MLQNLKQLTSSIGDFGLHFVLTRDNGKPVLKQFIGELNAPDSI